MSGLTVFLAGAIQGDRDDGVVDQGYRAQIQEIVAQSLPGAVCYDPARPTARALRQLAHGEAEGVAAAMARATSRGPVALGRDGGPALTVVSRAFLEATAQAAECSICVAYLPGNGMSMGTAMEMYAAKAAGRPVVTVTQTVGNLAILSATDVLVGDLADLGEALAMVAQDLDAGRSVTQEEVGHAG